MWELLIGWIVGAIVAGLAWARFHDRMGRRPRPPAIERTIPRSP